MDELERKNKILEYIEGHLGCTKTSLENGVDMAPRTVRKHLQNLIEDEKKVVCIVDKANPRIHHLFINDQVKLAIMSLAMSRVEEQMKNQRYTIAEMVGGGYAVQPHGGLPIFTSTIGDSVKRLIGSVNQLKSLL